MQIRTDPPPRRLAGAGGAEPLTLGSDWPMTATRGGFSGQSARLLPRWPRPGRPVAGSCPRGLRLLPVPAGGGASGSAVDLFLESVGLVTPGGRGRGGAVS